MSLFRLCLEFISSHISNVDSLIGFPQMIGIQLFEACKKKGQFRSVRTDVKARNALRIFFDAYGDSQMLNILDLKTCHLFVNDILIDCLWLIRNVSHLDLSSCKLGDDHELLPLLMKLTSLETLNLCDNCLSDRGIWKATLPLRFGKQINVCLKNLNVSLNKITPSCLHHLSPLQGLAVVKVSDTSFVLKDSTTSQERHFVSHHACQCVDSLFSFDSSGWATDVIERWKSECGSSVNSKTESSCFSSPPLALTPTLLSSSSTPSSALSSIGSHGVKSFYSKCITTQQETRKYAPSVKTRTLVLVTDLFHCEHVESKKLQYNKTESQNEKKIYCHDFQTSSKLDIAACQSRIKKRPWHELESGGCVDEANLSISGTTSLNKKSAQSVESMPERLLDLYHGDKAKPTHVNVKGNLLSGLNDWS